MLRTENLSKSYDNIDSADAPVDDEGLHSAEYAIRDINLHIHPGEIYGFLGPNGAGKTTTIRILLGLLPATSGTVFLFDRPITHNLVALKHRIGVVAEEPQSATRMTGWETVRFFADLNNVRQPEKRMEMLFRRLDLWSARNALASAYSRGMRQKLSLIRAMVHQPDLLILDEPVSGLDPHGILQVRSVIEQHRDEGGSVLISSHILSEVERSADRIGILHKGQLLVEDTINGIRSRLGSDNIIRLSLAEPAPALADNLRAIPEVQQVTVQESQVSIRVAGTCDARPAIFHAVVDSGGVLLEMSLEEMSLEEAFVTITNKNVQRLAGAE